MLSRQQQIEVEMTHDTHLGAPGVSSGIAQHGHQRLNQNGRNNRQARATSAAKDQQSLSMSRRALLLTPAFLRAHAEGKVLPRCLTSAQHLARKGLQIEVEHEKSGKVPHTSHAARVAHADDAAAKIPRDKRERARDLLRKKTEGPLPRDLSSLRRLRADIRKEEHAVYMAPGRLFKKPASHVRVQDLKSKWADKIRSKQFRASLRLRCDPRLDLWALDALEARERQESNVEALRLARQMDEVRSRAASENDPLEVLILATEMQELMARAASNNYTLHPASEASIAEATPRGGLDWAAAHASGMNKVVVSKGSTSSSMPKKKSPLSNVMLA